MARVPNSLIGMAGVYFVAAELSRRGLVALPTVRNVAGPDLLVFDTESGRQAAIQVKASGSNVDFWPIGTLDKAHVGSNYYYAFVRFNNEKHQFEVFIEPADRVTEQVQCNVREQVSRGNKEFPDWRLPKSQKELQALLETWRNWRP